MELIGGGERGGEGGGGGGEVGVNMNNNLITPGKTRT